MIYLILPMACNFHTKRIWLKITDFNHEQKLHQIKASVNFFLLYKIKEKQDVNFELEQLDFFVSQEKHKRKLTISGFIISMTHFTLSCIICKDSRGSKWVKGKFSIDKQ